MVSMSGLRMGSGLFDWLIQRVSAVIIGAWVLTLMISMLLHPTADHQQWQAIFEPLPMRLLSLLAVASLSAHGWIGLWTVGTDYLTVRQLGRSATVIHRIYQAVCIALIALYLLWGLRIFWSI